MKNEIKDLADRLRREQKFKSNIDGLIWDYGFYTELNRLVKKQREETLAVALTAGGNKPLESGTTVVKGQKLNIDLKIIDMSKFDKEVFISKIMAYYGDKVDGFKLRELAMESVVPSGDRKEFKVVDKTVSF